VGERKVKALLRAGSSVHVISPVVTPRLALLAAEKKIDLTRRPYRRGDLKRRSGKRTNRELDGRVVLAFAATDNPETQRAVQKDAAALGVLVNTADEIEHSDFIVPASFAEGDLGVAISTAGASPALARLLRQQLKFTLGRKYRAYLQFLRESRQKTMEAVPRGARRTKILRQLGGRKMLDLRWKGAGSMPIAEGTQSAGVARTAALEAHGSSPEPRYERRSR